MDVIKVSVDERSCDAQFYLQMYLQSQVSFFTIYDSRTVRNLTRCMTYHKVQAGEFVYKKGQRGDEMFVVMQGTIGTYLSSKNPTDYTNKLTETFCFGEKALQGATEAPRDHYAVALEPCNLLSLGRFDFQDKTF